MRIFCLFRRLPIGLIVASLVYSAAAHAQKPPIKKMALQEATVFLRGAELFSTGTIDLPAGETEILLVNVAGRINEQSLSIGADNGVLVQSFTVQSNYLTEETLSPQAEEIKQHLETAEREKGKLVIQLEIIKEQLTILAGNRKVGDEKVGTSAAEVGRMIEFAGNKMAEILALRAASQLQIKELDEKIEKLRSQFTEEKGKNFQPGGQIAVRFYTPKAVSSRIQLSYVVPQAGWVPTYDLRVDKIGAPIKLIYKANVFQNSGINWDKVRIVLSTGNPSAGAQSPVLNPWRLSLYDPRPRAMPALGAAPAAPLMRAEAAAEMDYAPEPSPGPPREDRRSDNAQQALDGYVTTNADGIDTKFDIALPYTIPSDGKGHLIMVKSADMKGDYRYVAIPKLDRDAFLQAQISDWENLNLLPGKSNIFYEGIFIGQGHIDVRNLTEPMTVSLGRDKRIIVSRDNDQNFTSKPEFFGSTVSQKFSYNINVKNTRKETIKLVIIDQAPISSDSEVKITDLKHDGAEYKGETGAIQWTLNLEANEAAKLPFAYTVRYPKDMRVNGL